MNAQSFFQNDKPFCAVARASDGKFVDFFTVLNGTVEGLRTADTIEKISHANQIGNY
jgi:hypothetical protein